MVQFKNEGVSPFALLSFVCFLTRCLFVFLFAGEAVFSAFSERAVAPYPETRHVHSRKKKRKKAAARKSPLPLHPKAT